MQAFLHSVGEAITPVLTNSKFRETGVLNPKEFEVAGDYLTHICPTWKWNTCEDNKLRTYLDRNKQYLSTKNVPCHKRVAQMEANVGQEKMVEGVNGDNEEDEWVDTSPSFTIGGDVKDDEINDIQNSSKGNVWSQIGALKIQEVDSEEDSSEIEDIDDIEDVDDAILHTKSSNSNNNNNNNNHSNDEDNIVRTRTYDLSITYDKYYQTPRLWLSGYDEHGQPLTEKQMFEDFSQDHAKKTVTCESHPHLPCNMMSIHPCKHSDVMKRILQNYESTSGSKEGFGVHLYLIIFLKFVQSVIPTIEYDFTTDFAMA